jgi:ubiquinone/menaquinone biosynthesis C-methylase UbiE
VAREHHANHGFLRGRDHLVLVVLTGIALLVAPWVALGALILWAADLVVYVRRRRRLLDEFARGRPRIENDADIKAMLAAYRQAGVAEQDMSDYERAAGHADREQWRKDLRYEEVIEHLTRRAPIPVLIDIGTGDGRLAWRHGAADLCRRFIGFDIGHALLRELRTRMPDAVAAVADCSDRLPVADASVDAIVCTEAFEHLARPERALAEFARVLKPGGEVIIQSPSASQLRNLNPLHVLQCVVGLWFPRILLPIVVHENTWVRAYSYHWDFPIQWFHRHARPLGLTIRSAHCATYRFNPRGSLVHRFAYWAFRSCWPLTRFGWDMTIVMERTRTNP